MSEMSFEQMLEESFKTIHNGEVVDGTVISVKPELSGCLKFNLHLFVCKYTAFLQYNNKVEPVFS